MKYLVVLILSIISQIAMSGEYDFYFSDMEAFLGEIGKSSKGIDAGEMLSYFKEYSDSLSTDGEPLFRKIYSHAIEENYNLQSEDYIPNMIQLVSLCSNGVTNKINTLKKKRLKKEDVVVYAAILNCASIIRFTSNEINRFRSANSKFLEAHEYQNKVKSFTRQSRNLLSVIDRDGLFYFGYLMVDSAGNHQLEQ